MASQAEIQAEKIRKYASMPLYDPDVLAEMLRQHQYANTIDPEKSKKASQILNG